MTRFVDIVLECVESFPEKERDRLIKYVFSSNSDNCVASVFGVTGHDSSKIQDKLLDSMANLNLVRPLLNLVTKVKVADVDHPDRWRNIMDIAEDACMLVNMHSSVSKSKEFKQLFKTQPILQGMFLLECLNESDFPDYEVTNK